MNLRIAISSMPIKVVALLGGIFALAALGTGCAGTDNTTVGAGNGSGSGTTSSYNLAGSWTGSFVSETGSRGTSSGTFAQTGSALSGDFTAINACFGGGKIDATLSGDMLSGTVVAGAVSVSLDGTIVSNMQIDGTYTLAAAGACPADQGSFHLSR